MTPSTDAPIRVVAVSVVADVSPTSRPARAGDAADLATVRTTMLLEEPDADLVFPVRLSARVASRATLAGGDQIVLTHAEVAAVPLGKGEFRLSLPVPEVSDLVEIVEGSPVDVIVLLPAWPGVELADWSTEKPATVYGTEYVAADAPGRADLERLDPIAGRVAVAWRFDRDPNLDVVWRYLDTNG